MSDTGPVTLPPNVRPMSYDITLEPDLEAFTFLGAETIDVEVLEPTASVELNCIEIAIRSCRADAGGRRRRRSQEYGVRRGAGDGRLRVRPGGPPGARLPGHRVHG